MKKFSIVGALLSMLLAPSLTHASGVLLEANGKVQVTLAGGAQAAPAPGLELPDGTIVAAEKGAKASILLESGAVDEVAGGVRYIVGAKAAGAKRTDLGGGVALAMRELSSSGEGPQVHGMVKEAKGPPRNLPDMTQFGTGGFAALFPAGTAIRLGQELAFRWSGVAGKIAKPVLVVDDAQKKHVVVRPIVPEKGAFTADARALGLAKGKSYSWYLGDGEKAPQGKTARFEFTTLSATEERALDAEIAKVRKLGLGEDATALLSAQLYYARGMFDDLVKTLEPLWQKEPGPFVKKLLAAGNARMGRTEEAKKYK